MESMDTETEFNELDFLKSKLQKLKVYLHKIMKSESIEIYPCPYLLMFRSYFLDKV